MTIYTFGHGVLPQVKAMPYFSGITTLIDIRSHPTSKWAQWRRDELPKWLPIKYEWWPQLGGWTEDFGDMRERMKEFGVNLEPYMYSPGFPKHHIAKLREDICSYCGDTGEQRTCPYGYVLPDVCPKRRPQWTSQGLYDYSWFMSMPCTISWLDRLIKRSKIENVAIMCCETLWWKCHRSQVADYCVFQGTDVRHLQPTPTWHSQVLGNRLERYDPRIIKAWKGEREFLAFPARKPKPSLRVARINW